jgi:hypothetical protein
VENQEIRDHEIVIFDHPPEKPGIYATPVHATGGI